MKAMLLSAFLVIFTAQGFAAETDPVLEQDPVEIENEIALPADEFPGNLDELDDFDIQAGDETANMDMYRDHDLDRDRRRDRGHYRRICYARDITGRVYRGRSPRMALRSCHLRSPTRVACVFVGCRSRRW